MRKMTTRAPRGYAFSTEYTEPVLAGIAFLDRVKPNWREEMDLPSLDLSRGMHCVLGQVYGGFWNACSKLVPQYSNDFDVLDWGSKYGFALRPGHATPKKWSDLTEEWTQHLQHPELKYIKVLNP